MDEYTADPGTTALAVSGITYVILHDLHGWTCARFMHTRSLSDGPNRDAFKPLYFREKTREPGVTGLLKENTDTWLDIAVLSPVEQIPVA